MKHLLLFGLFSLQWVYGQGPIRFTKEQGNFQLVSDQKAAGIVWDDQEAQSVTRAIEDWQQDIEKVTGIRPARQLEKTKRFVLVGTLGKNRWIDELVKARKLSTQQINGKWETYLQTRITKPWKGVDEIFVIVGSDPRGTIYGLYDLSSAMGVSPWHFWADVPVQHHSSLYLAPGTFSAGEPKVKYRGIFLNDEAPCLSGWTWEKNGGFNQKLYSRVFELILRLKANFLWPAMWGNAFYVDDPQNADLAEAYGVVVGTSHHEPMMRAHDEWRRYGQKGPWDYTQNDSTLRAFWKESTEKRYAYDNIFTIGMRGDGDEPMTQETATALLEKIVADQRKILEEVSGRPAAEKPQVWALYKEVQEYYDQGMRVPDDVTLLLCDDNWGNIRKLPTPGSEPRQGGYGIYYHFDYVGGPRNYKWVNTNNIARVWEQMRLAYAHDAKQLWIVNVGDLKPMEVPIDFFLTMAWNPEEMTLDRMATFHSDWATQQFGSTWGATIGKYIEKYTQINARIKPELMQANTFSWSGSPSEWDLVVSEYVGLARESESTYQKLPKSMQDAYYQLVLYPILACSNVYELYYAHGKHLLAWQQKDEQQAHRWADLVRYHFQRDQELSDYFNHQLAGGKWNHFADQTHIGYTYWQQPEKQVLPVLFPEKMPFSIQSTDPLTAWKVNIPQDFTGWVQDRSVVTWEASDWSKAVSSDGIVWEIIPGIGRTGNGVSTQPLTFPRQKANTDGAHLIYDVYITRGDSIQVEIQTSPILAYREHETVTLGFSWDDGPIETLRVDPGKSARAWEKMVAHNVQRVQTSSQTLVQGKHQLKIWALDPAVVIQKISLLTQKGDPRFLSYPTQKSKYTRGRH